MRLLIVDDEVWSRMLIRKILPWREMGFTEIAEAGDGQVALELLNKQPFDLMITDMRMPRLDGAEMLKEVRAAQYPVEIIVMSGYEDYVYLHQALKTKATDYLLKPVGRTELEKAVSRAQDIIHTRQSYQHIEQVLVHEDLSQILSQYYESKNQLYKSLISQDPVRLTTQLDRLQSLFTDDTLKSTLKVYMEKDLFHFVQKLEKEYNHQNVSSLVKKFDMQQIRDNLIAILNMLIHQTVSYKLNVLDVQTYIDAHFSDSISLADVATRFHISKEHLSRLFKKEVGMSVQAYITQKKIDYAKNLLKRYHQLNLATIGMMSGFIDVQYFHRVFRNHTGMTPTQYRGKKSI